MSEASETAEVRWVEIRLTVPETDALRLEPLDEACLQVSPGGFVVEGADAPPGDVEVPARGTVRYRVYVGEAELDAARLLLEAAASAFPGSTLETAPLDDGWRERWKQYFLPVQVSPRLVVTPPWRVEEVAASAPRATQVLVEPAMAFGTAQHETTFLCLQVLDELGADGVGGLAGCDVLDVGAGTGVLGIAAAKLGARRVLLIDNDPQAVRAAAENIALNDVGAVVTAAGTPVERVGEAFPIVLANIIAPVLIGMAGPLTNRLTPGGKLVLSGVLAEQDGEVLAAFTQRGLRHLETRPLRGWVAITLEKPASSA